MGRDIILIGYSGHAYVVADALISRNQNIVGYCEVSEIISNPYKLKYFGSEDDPSVLAKLEQYGYFIAVGDNWIRRNIYYKLREKLFEPCNTLHQSAIISKYAYFKRCIFVGPGSIINSHAQIGTGVICNSGSIIEHECILGDFVHIAPGAILGGNVRVGDNTLIGAGSVVKPGIQIGKNVVVGAGAVVVKHIPDNITVIGNPSKQK